MNNKMFDLEQRIMNCWNVVDDIDYIYRYISDDELFIGMKPKHGDKILTLLLGIKEMYAIKFDKCFRDFEEVDRLYSLKIEELEEQLRVATNQRESLDWPTDDERVDIIGQNGNDGDHYRGSIDDATPEEWDILYKSYYKGTEI